VPRINEATVEKRGRKRDIVITIVLNFRTNRLLWVMEKTIYSAVFTIVRVIKSRRMGWSGHVARIGEVRNAYSILFLEKEYGDTIRKT
jgi:hypothetical protein